MKYLLLMFFIPMSYAATAPSCSEMNSILKSFESKLQKDNVDSCSGLTASEFLKDVALKDGSFFDKKKCLPLNSIETELENLKIRQGVLDGIKKIKVQVQTSQEDADSPSFLKAAEAGKTFISSLNTAQSFELLLQTPVGDKLLIDKLKKDVPEDKRKTAKDLLAAIADLCKEQKKDASNACNTSLFKPSQETVDAISDLIKNGDTSETEVAKWQAMLAIKKKGSDEKYSFTQMQAELGDSFGEVGEKLSKNQLRAIQKLSEFESAKGLAFVEKIAGISEKQQNTIEFSRINLLIDDARTRQQFEVRAKMSTAWSNFGSNTSKLTAEDREKCEASASSFDNSKDCYQALKVIEKDLSDDMRSFLEAAEVSLDYEASLAQGKTSCAEFTKTNILSDECKQSIETELADVQEKILQLNALKAKIATENDELMKLRNFALKKWQDQSCQSGVPSSSMDLCETEISKDVNLLFIDTMKIAIAYTPKDDTESEAKKICDEIKDGDTSPKAKICNFFDDTTPTNIVPDAPASAKSVGMSPDSDADSVKIRDAWTQGLANIAGTTLGMLFPQRYVPPTAGMYPYNYNTPRPSPFGCKGTAECSVLSARINYGYGVYTPPTQAYSSDAVFGSSSQSYSQYSTLSSSSSKFFKF